MRGGGGGEVRGEVGCRPYDDFEVVVEVVGLVGCVGGVR